MHIYTYTPTCGLICIIHTSDTLCSPKERFSSTNNRSISSDCYRETKFLAKTTFVLLTDDSPQYLVLCLTLVLSSVSILIEKQTFCSVQSLSSLLRRLKFEFINYVTLHGCPWFPQIAAESLGK